jgi:hypothetical protein
MPAVPLLAGYESENKHNKTRIKPNSFSRNRMHLKRSGSQQTGPKKDNKDASITRIGYRCKWTEGKE